MTTLMQFFSKQKLTMTINLTKEIAEVEKMGVNIVSSKHSNDIGSIHAVTH